MNINEQQINEDYKFRISYIISLFKDMFSTSNEIEETDVDNKIKEIERNQDIRYIENLEKELDNHNQLIKKSSKVKNANFNSKNVKTKTKNEQEKNEDIDIMLDEDYEK